MIRRSVDRGKQAVSEAITSFIGHHQVTSQRELDVLLTTRGMTGDRHDWGHGEVPCPRGAVLSPRCCPRGARCEVPPRCRGAVSPRCPEVPCPRGVCPRCRVPEVSPVVRCPVPEVPLQVLSPRCPVPEVLPRCLPEVSCPRGVPRGEVPCPRGAAPGALPEVPCPRGARGALSPRWSPEVVPEVLVPEVLSEVLSRGARCPRGARHDWGHGEVPCPRGGSLGMTGGMVRCPVPDVAPLSRGARCPRGARHDWGHGEVPCPRGGCPRGCRPVPEVAPACCPLPKVPVPSDRSQIGMSTERERPQKTESTSVDVDSIQQE